MREMRIRFFTAALLLVLPACGKNEYVPPPPPSVTVSQPVQKSVIRYLEFSGNTVGAETVDVRARVEGYLQSINFTPSSRVNQGELLFVIDPLQYQAALDKARASLASAQAQLKLAEATLARKENAFQSRAVSEVEVLQARAERDSAAASIQGAQAAVDSAVIDLGYTQVKAPVEGRISRNLVDTGNLVGRGEATLLTTIVRYDPMHVYFDIGERDLLDIRPGSDRRRPDQPMPHIPVEIGLSNEKGFPHKGTIDFADNRINPSTGTIQLRGVFQNPDNDLLPGLFVRVRVPVGSSENALLVPERALGTDESGRYVLVATDKDLVEHRTVKVASIMEGMAIIQEGVRPQDWVIVNGLQRARPGAKVQTTKAAPADDMKSSS